MAGKHGTRREAKNQVKARETAGGQHRTSSDPRLLPSGYQPKHRIGNR